MSLDFELFGEVDLGGDDPVVHVVFECNITHNLAEMARHAGLYNCLWRPDEFDYTSAKNLIPQLKIGIANLEEYPDKFRQYEPPNGWGSYQGLLRTAKSILLHCEKYPEAKIRACR